MRSRGPTSTSSSARSSGRGRYKLDKDTSLTVLKAIILAGGFTDKAAKSGIKVTREEGAQKRTLKADLDTLVRFAGHHHRPRELLLDHRPGGGVP